MCVLSAIGTAAVINPQFTMSEGSKPPSASVMSPTPRDNERDIFKDVKNNNGTPAKLDNDVDSNAQVPSGCGLCHIPHSKLILPVNGKMKKCAVCK